MGNSSKKLAAKCHFLSKEEQQIVSASFRIISKNSDKIKEDDLVKNWGPLLDSRLLNYIANYLFFGAERAQFISLSKYAELFVFCTRGTIDEKLHVLVKSLGKSESDLTGVTYQLVKEYVESIIASYMKLQKVNVNKWYKSWFSKGCYIAPLNVQRLAESLTLDLSGHEHEVQRKALENWLQNATILGQLLLYVFHQIYRLNPPKDKPPSADARAHQSAEEDEDKGDRNKSLIPMCCGLDLIPSYPSILDLNQIVFVNSHLPQQYQLQWRFLFSSEIHGESFATLIGRVIDRGPTIIFVEDRHGYTFGGFAPASWTITPKFYGDDSSFLFTLTPKMRVFPSTGYNQHFQYMNTNQQTLPNGLGMGGQLNYCGLWLDSEYGIGHTSETCTTYANYKTLSYSKKFTYTHLEVWGLGETPDAPLENPSRVRSILDGQGENKAILQMAGRTTYSDGVRPPSPVLE